MPLANDGVAGNAVGELSRDLAGAQPVEPQFAQEFHSFIGPGHLSPPRLDQKASLNAVHTTRRNRRLHFGVNPKSTPRRKTGVLQEFTHLDRSAARDVVVDSTKATLPVESCARLPLSPAMFSTTASRRLLVASRSRWR